MISPGSVNESWIVIVRVARRDVDARAETEERRQLDREQMLVGRLVGEVDSDRWTSRSPVCRSDENASAGGSRILSAAAARRPRGDMTGVAPTAHPPSRPSLRDRRRRRPRPCRRIPAGHRRHRALRGFRRPPARRAHDARLCCALGRNSIPRTHLSSVSFVGMTKLRNTSGPLAGRSKPPASPGSRSGCRAASRPAETRQLRHLRRVAARHPCFTQLAIVAIWRRSGGARRRTRRSHARRATAACSFDSVTLAISLPRFFDVFVGDERERRRPRRAMAGHAVGVDDRRDRSR